MIPMKSLPAWEPGEEIASAATHAIGIVFSFIATILVIVQQVKNYNRNKTIGMAIFCASMFILYTVSTCYHGVKQEKIKKIMRYGDHCSIYLLIAGSYAPYCLTVLADTNGTLLLIVIWSYAAIGIFLKIMWFDYVDTISLLYYIVMGWLVVSTLGTLVRNFEPAGIYYLFLAGVSYTLGTMFFARDKIAYTHAIWHLFVLCGTICSFISSYVYC
ncbi:channel protein, hemolysin III family protein [Trichomonas vaginalis G3]|uniref:Channel protein, hemolysin III family protein n=1 Tax=Trichomonas vaginalis (strain ATCC PRA-98 / G3) TaxID=412133 RepID=A2DSN6_TRIV3|nr:cytolysis [Trichomonas vaginalis G3]EAY16616.1 channel protein, hemolysin III family protein [Trichomonas vaginalis G3]KAI5532993.1 cytolysis [Trichomonas vaginalis G3]|eukprot:XP_001328839.1 channel protein, hemolysin III family protein [Trichomonas vaginalis G3]